jgi:putative phosphoesterase
VTGAVGLRVGLVSDTHGLFDPKLPQVFAGCEVILHGGDVVKPEVLERLAAIAPVTAVRGNNDGAPAFAGLPETALVPIGPLTALVVHDLGARDRPKPPARALLAERRPEIVVHGHSHRPGVALSTGTLFVNPGSAGPRRFSLPRTAAVLTARGRTVQVAFVDLAGDRPAPLGGPQEFRL